MSGCLACRRRLLRRLLGSVRLVVSGVVATAVAAVAAVPGVVSAVIAAVSAVSAVSGVAAVSVTAAVLIAVLRRIGCGLLGVLFGLRRLLILPCLGLLRAGAPCAVRAADLARCRSVR